MIAWLSDSSAGTGDASAGVERQARSEGALGAKGE
jgi:hypothetical protein